jgi:hypothetical protein
VIYAGAITILLSLNKHNNMKSNFPLLKSGFAMLAGLALTFSANATTFTATTSGNFSASGTWSGGTAPSTNLTTADNIIINTGVTVTLDQDVTINNATASLAVNGTLSGTHSLNIQSGSLTGSLTGSLSIHDLTLGSGSSTTYLGSTTVDNMYNSETLLSLAGATTVNDTVGLLSGSAQVSTGVIFTLGSNATLNIAGGSFSAAGGGTLTLLGNVNILYSGSGSLATGVELGLSHINNVTVNLSSSSNQLSMSSDLTVPGQLSVQSGSLNMNGHNLTLNGTVATSATGSLSGSSTSNLTLGGGAGSMGTLMFTSGSNTVNNLTVNGAASGYATLATDLNVAGTLTLTSGGINLSGSSNLTLTGTDSITGGSATSYIATSGTGSLVASVAGGASLDNSRMFHVGTAAGYAPVRVTNSSSTTGNFSANAHSGIYANGTSGTDLSSTRSSVNTSWNVESDIQSGANVTLTAYWNSSMEVNTFNRSTVYLSHYTNSAWDATANVQATVMAGGMASVSRSGITSFSPFAVFSGYATGINDVAANSAFSAYPNPANNSITVTVADANTTTDAKVYDILGNQVATYPMHGTKNTIDITNLTSGVYFLSVNNATQKFVKN